MTEFRSVSLIALGANLPQGRFSPELTLGRACVALSDAGVVIRAVSRFYATPCFPAGAGPDYVNAVLAVDAGDDPSDLLALLHRIEREHGRERVRRWGMRTLDMDIVAFGDAVLPDAGIYSRVARPAGRGAAAAHARPVDPAASASAGPRLCPDPGGGCRARLASPGLGVEHRGNVLRAAGGRPCRGHADLIGSSPISCLSSSGFAHRTTPSDQMTNLEIRQWPA